MNLFSTIVFFGSGPVAAATLDAIYKAGFKIEAIITKPRPDGHRGSVPVVELGVKLGLPMFHPTNKQELSELFATHTFSSPVGLVVDYGIIIAQDVIDSFPKGIVNSHFSLLPQWRGADPITFSVLSGQTETGVSLMVINSRLDEGQLIAQEKLSLPTDITTPQLTNQLVDLSNKMIFNYLPRYIAGDIKPYMQASETPSYSRKLTKEDALLRPDQKPADQLEREVRAFKGWPKSKITLFDKFPVVITKARVATSPTDGAIVVPCAKHTYLEIVELIAPSGRTMSGSDFLRGYNR